jgi:hypothetical protein
MMYLEKCTLELAVGRDRSSGTGYLSIKASNYPQNMVLGAILFPALFLFADAPSNH